MQERLMRATRSWTIREAKKRAVIHLERVYYRSRGPARSRFAHVNTGSEHCYSFYDSLKTISRGTSSPSNPCAARLAVYNLRKSAALKLTIIFVPSQGGGKYPGVILKFRAFGSTTTRQLSRET